MLVICFIAAFYLNMLLGLLYIVWVLDRIFIYYYSEELVLKKKLKLYFEQKHLGMPKLINRNLLYISLIHPISISFLVSIFYSF